jgi:predicted TIM-barrel fold metal-dependent hydrolase
MLDATKWWDGVELNEPVRDKIARDNARRLLKLA